MTEEDATVLVVDDDEDLLRLYERYLGEEYDVRTATNGEEALETVDQDCQVIVLDRRLPDIPGDEVLSRINDRHIDLRVVMVTAVEPDFDIIEMDFDDYLVKPVSKDRLLETVEHLQTRAEYSTLLDKYYRTANKIAALESAKSPDELAESEEFSELHHHARELQQQVTDTLQELDDYAGAFHEVERIPNLSDDDGSAGGPS